RSPAAYTPAVERSGTLSCDDLDKTSCRGRPAHLSRGSPRASRRVLRLTSLRLCTNDRSATRNVSQMACSCGLPTYRESMPESMGKTQHVRRIPPAGIVFAV